MSPQPPSQPPDIESVERVLKLGGLALGLLAGLWAFIKWPLRAAARGLFRAAMNDPEVQRCLRDTLHDSLLKAELGQLARAAHEVQRAARGLQQIDGELTQLHEGIAENRELIGEYREWMSDLGHSVDLALQLPDRRSHEERRIQSRPRGVPAYIPERRHITRREDDTP